jgi:hypothetical protein
VSSTKPPRAKPKFFISEVSTSVTSTLSYSSGSLVSDESDDISDYSGGEEDFEDEKSLFTKQQLPVKRPSLLSIALQRNAFRNSQTQLQGLSTQGLSTVAGAPSAGLCTVPPKVCPSRSPSSPINDFSASELTPSLKENLMWDHAMPFGMKIDPSGSPSSTEAFAGAPNLGSSVLGHIW